MSVWIDVRIADPHIHVPRCTRITSFSVLDDGDGFDKTNTISFVIINPASDLQLEAGDIIYVIRSPVKEDAKSHRINPRRGLRRERNVQESTIDDTARDGSQVAVNIES
ncbi:unnamed protein product [Strongylus vulgaris]|uniref:Uncharacterized protein n=1 Tax=Strongylus vulgaris TaxID=40348 RepID=A0A3P7JBB9_STRVU|nr:unnamed protein product [Strongylus vulgaris]